MNTHNYINKTLILSFFSIVHSYINITILNTCKQNIRTCFDKNIHSYTCI